MGWLFGWDNRKSLIEHLTKKVTRKSDSPADSIHTFETIKSCTRGNVLWAVMKNTVTETNGNSISETFIACILLQNGGGRDGWGYKDMDERMGPYYFTCPTSYFDLVPVPDSATAKQWRDEVRKYQNSTKVPVDSYVVFDNPVRFNNGREFVAFKRNAGKQRTFTALAWSDLEGSAVGLYSLVKLSSHCLSGSRPATKEEAEKAVRDRKFNAAAAAACAPAA